MFSWVRKRKPSWFTDTIELILRALWEILLQGYLVQCTMWRIEHLVAAFNMVKQTCDFSQSSCRGLTFAIQELMQQARLPSRSITDYDDLEENVPFPSSHASHPPSTLVNCISQRNAHKNPDWANWNPRRHERFPSQIFSPFHNIGSFSRFRNVDALTLQYECCGGMWNVKEFRIRMWVFLLTTEACPQPAMAPPCWPRLDGLWFDIYFTSSMTVCTWNHSIWDVLTAGAVILTQHSHRKDEMSDGHENPVLLHVMMNDIGTCATWKNRKMSFTLETSRFLFLCRSHALVARTPYNIIIISISGVITCIMCWKHLDSSSIRLMHHSILPKELSGAYIKKHVTPTPDSF